MPSRFHSYHFVVGYILVLERITLIRKTHLLTEFIIAAIAFILKEMEKVHCFAMMQKTLMTASLWKSFLKRLLLIKTYTYKKD